MRIKENARMNRMERLSFNKFDGMFSNVRCLVISNSLCVILNLEIASRREKNNIFACIYKVVKYAIGCGKGKITDAKVTMETIDIISKEYNVNIQLFNADSIIGETHILSALLHAKRAFEQNKNTSDNLMTETLLYASGERQIRHAIKKIGIQEGEDSRVCILVYCENCENRKEKNSREIREVLESVISRLGLFRDDSLILPNEEKLNRLGCSRDEVDAVLKSKRYELALEKVALVDIKK
ncbi:MAG: KEOPS complex subunit Cgi121 [Thermoplasmata archaeon]